MAQWRLDKTENALNRIGWKVTEKIPSNDNFIGGWKIRRGSSRIVNFEGIFNGLGNIIKNPSLDKAYCDIQDTKISLYFYKKGKMWNESFKNFVDELNKLE